MYRQFGRVNRRIRAAGYVLLGPIMMDLFPFCRQQGIRAVVFDWDGVMVDSGEISAEAYRRVLAEFGIEVDRREILIREGQPTADLIISLLAKRGISLTPQKLPV